MSRPATALLAGLAAAALAGCLRDHDPDLVQTSTNDCLTCHLHDYQNATAPVHEGSFPRTCGDCHRTEGWQPAIEGVHPAAARFSITRGAHSDIACLDCHDPDRGTSHLGANTICTSCHRRSENDGRHDEVRGYMWHDDDPRFCLECHPSGRGGD